MLKVVWLAGLPCSGKSTKVSKDYKGYTIISFDSLILEHFKTSNYNLAYEKYSKLDRSEKYWFVVENRNRFNRAVTNKENIVLDFVNLTEDILSPYSNITPHYYEKEYILLDTDFETILMRNKLRENKLIPVEVLEKMRELKKEEHYKKFNWHSVTVLK